MLAVREVLHLTRKDARRVPWRNGRGVTEELALWPAAASFERGDFDGRISRARVDEPGPFSTYPGFERLIVVTAGAGLVLDHGGAAPRARLRSLEPYRFQGEWPTTAEPVSGPVTDFNVLVRRESARAEIEVLRLGARSARVALPGRQAFAHVAAGRVRARVTGEDEPFELESGESLWLSDLAGGEELDGRGLAADAVVLLVHVDASA